MKNKTIFFTLILIIILLILFLINYKVEENFTSKKIVVSKLIGGLANRIYMVLAGLAFANKWNMDYYFLDSQIEDDPHSNRDIMKEELKILFPNINFLDKSTDTLLWANINEANVLANNNIDNNIILHGYFQNEEKYFIDYKIQLPEPKDNILKNFDTSNLFFIHFRFGDYLGTSFELDLIEYYKKCIQIIKNEINNPLFLIITNDINVTNKYMKKNQILISDDSIIDTSKNRLDTLYYITKCKGGICSNSSFSRIGAYFIENRNKDLIFYPIKKEEQITINWLTTVVIN